MNRILLDYIIVLSFCAAMLAVAAYGPSVTSALMGGL